MANTNINPYGQSAEMPAGYPIADNLTTNSAQQTLSAKQGKILNEKCASKYNVIGRRFVDFGAMPSCVYGETDCFLGDGMTGTTNSDGNPDTRIKYADVIAKYDALVSAYPNYAKKHSFGNDASGTIPMYYYTFTPKYYTQHIYLQAGVHGWEPDPVFALAEIMYLIGNAYGGNLSPKVINNPELMFLRGSVKFTIVPCVNPCGFNRRSDCGIDKRVVAQNNYNNKQLNAEWSNNVTECNYVRNLLDSISDLSFAIDMHSTVVPDTRDWYGCFYGACIDGTPNVRTMFRTWEWLYEFYDVRYPHIVQGDTCPNPLSDSYNSCGVSTGTGSFRGWFINRYGKPGCTLEFSDHVWTDDADYYDPTHHLDLSKIPAWDGHQIGDAPADSEGNMIPLHTAAAMSVAVNMYLNHIIQQALDGYEVSSLIDVPSTDKKPTRG